MDRPERYTLFFASAIRAFMLFEWPNGIDNGTIAPSTSA
jgi:hypothetical protein